MSARISLLDEGIARWMLMDAHPEKRILQRGPRGSVAVLSKLALLRISRTDTKVLPTP
jgi:hypothetical protein